MPFRDEDIDNLVITATDARRAGYCPSGLRKWLELNGFDARKAFKEGIPARDCLAIGDADAINIVERTLRNRGLS